MSAEDNKALVRRFIRAQWQKDFVALKEMMAPEFVDHSVIPGQGLAPPQRPASRTCIRYKTLTRYVMEELVRFTGEGWEQEDDITLVALQRLTARAQASPFAGEIDIDREEPGQSG